MQRMVIIRMVMSMNHGRIAIAVYMIAARSAAPRSIIIENRLEISFDARNER